MNQRHSPRFGELLKQLRESAGFSQETLAERSGLSVRAISDLERGARSTPRLGTVRLLAEALQLSESDRQRLFESRRSHDPSRNREGSPTAELPVPSTSFIGRTYETEIVAKAFTSDSSRLVTLIGPGGVGKTRIAIEAAHSLGVHFLNGVVFVDLTPVRNSHMVVPSIASCIGVSGESGGDLKESVFVALQDRKMLLVLDNLEHVVDAADDLSWLLRSCPKVSILATSRIPLRIGMESVIPIEPMEIPSTVEMANLQDIDAMMLFSMRATAASSSFFISNENVGVIREIVDRLQGMPLAIELAAARIRTLPPSALLERLERQLPTLMGGYRDAPKRHRTMRETIKWSYELLPPRDRSVFRALAIFPVGCTLETATVLLGNAYAITEQDVVESIEALVDSSLLRPRDSEDGQIRYSMLQTVREFGLEQLDAESELVSVRQVAHDLWCLPLAMQAEFLTAQPDIEKRLKRLEAEIGNLREHVTWLREYGHDIAALETAGRLAWYYALRGPFDITREDLESLLASPLCQKPDITRLRALIGLSYLPGQGKGKHSSRETLQEAESLARDLDQPAYLQFALNELGMSYTLTGNLELADRYLCEAHELAEETDSHWLRASLLQTDSIIAEMRGEWERALQLKREAVTVARVHGFVGLEAVGAGNLGYLLLVQHELDEAEVWLLHAMILWERLESKRGMPMCYLDLSDLARLQGDTRRARDMAERGLSLAGEIGSMRGMAENMRALARIALTEGDLIAARQWIASAIHWFMRSDFAVSAAQCLDVYGDIMMSLGMPDAAVLCIGAADAVLDERGIHRVELVEGEHDRRVQQSKALLDSAERQTLYERGRRTTIDEILAEMRSRTPDETVP